MLYFFPLQRTDSLGYNPDGFTCFPCRIKYSHEDEYMRHLRTVHGQMEPQATPIDAQRLDEALRSALKASYKKIVMEVPLPFLGSLLFL
jgi:hypothetical protein